MAQCMICGVHSSRNKNDSGFKNEYGEKMILCTTHNAAAEEVAEDGPLNWLALRSAAAMISNLVLEHPEQRDDLVQLEPLVRYYRQYAKAPKYIECWKEVQKNGKLEQQQKEQEARARAEKKQAALAKAQQKREKAEESAKRQG